MRRARDLLPGPARLRIPIHREGWPFIGFAAVLNLLLFLLFGVWGSLMLPVTLWTIAFFRDPERVPPAGEGLIVCPADGKLLPIVKVVPPAELEMGAGAVTRLSIFMNVFNVHVNRAPCDGTVTKLAYRPGKFFNASFDKASTDNERLSMRLRMAGADGAAGKDIAVVQIAGLIARRIVSETGEGQHLCRGARFGIIRFGSRVDVYLPGGARVTAKPGRSVRAGETILASYRS